MSNTIGNNFRVTTFGESHGAAIGAVIDGMPAGFSVDENFIQHEMNRRKPGQSSVTTQRTEDDNVKILSGVFEGKTLGTPIALLIENKNQNSSDYENIKNIYRPSHADFVYEKKYVIRDYRGGGRSSARTTAAVVAAGCLAKMILKKNGIDVLAYVNQVANISSAINFLAEENFEKSFSEKVEKSIVRCPDENATKEIITLIEKLKTEGDSAGGIIQCEIFNSPVGLGEPLFNKLQSDLAAAMFSINATHGFDYGSGFKGATKLGSENNDEFFVDGDKIKTKTNFSGGIQGGISNGMKVYFRVAFKAPASISKKQQTVNSAGENVELSVEGRHDVCVLPRAVPIVEAMAAIVLADHLLIS